MIATYETAEPDVVLSVSVEASGASVQYFEQRLERGWSIIDERSRDGQSVARLEDHWISLLAEYEAEFDRRRF